MGIATTPIRLNPVRLQFFFRVDNSTLGVWDPVEGGGGRLLEETLACGATTF